MTPNFLLAELAKQAPRLQNVELTFISVLGDIVVDRPEYENNFHINCLFVSDSVRQSVNEGRADFVPVFLSDIPDLFKNGQLSLDVALIQVSLTRQTRLLFFRCKCRYSTCCRQHRQTHHRTGKPERTAHTRRQHDTHRPYSCVCVCRKPIACSGLQYESRKRKNCKLENILQN
jgi:hypothetical protein